jgi:hypothetical protein
MSLRLFPTSGASFSGLQGFSASPPCLGRGGWLPAVVYPRDSPRGGPVLLYFRGSAPALYCGDSEETYGAIYR